jgi:hypothetical protein
LQIPLPKVLPLVIAAITISGDLKAADLIIPLEAIIFGLLLRGLHIISYACDGTEIKRALQRLIVSQLTDKCVYRIPNLGGPDLKICIAFLDGHPIAMIQDLKHAFKTFRKNMFFGA